MVLALPMEVIAPVAGIGAIVAFITGGIVTVRWAASRFPRPGTMDTSDRDQVLEDLQSRVGELEEMKQRVHELEERLDFAERLLASQRESPRLPPG